MILGQSKALFLSIELTLQPFSKFTNSLTIDMDSFKYLVCVVCVCMHMCAQSHTLTAKARTEHQTL